MRGSLLTRVPALLHWVFMNCSSGALYSRSFFERPRPINAFCILSYVIGRHLLTHLRAGFSPHSCPFALLAARVSLTIIDFSPIFFPHVLLPVCPLRSLRLTHSAPSLAFSLLPRSVSCAYSSHVFFFSCATSLLTFLPLGVRSGNTRCLHVFFA